jgi:hypothetical protein
METTLQTARASQSRSTTHSASGSKNLSAYDRLIANLNFSYFGLISMTVLIGSIIGGISAMFILKGNAPIWELGLCMATAMANNVAAIGQAPTKWVVNTFLTCTFVNTVLILLNVI